MLVVTVLLLTAPGALEARMWANTTSYGFASFGFAQDGQDMVRPTLAGERRVYVPHDVPVGEAGIFWFGRVTPDVNYTDVRVRTTEEGLLLTLATTDRRLWYNPKPSPDDLTSWDAVSIYLHPGGPEGEAPDAGSYRFDVQLRWWEQNTVAFRAAYQGDGSDWIPASVPFTATSGWNGDAPNNDKDDRGWMAYVTIPFTSLGLDGPPAGGTVWGLGVEVHDRDSAAVPPLPATFWPEAADPLRPASWGQLIFGLRPRYVPDPAHPQATAVIRHGLDGAEVVDADVGGSSVCGAAAAPDHFSSWGDLNYAGKEFLNVQRVDPISEWPCFSKYYVTFPLNAVPQGKIVLSATLTLYQFGSAGAGWDPPARPTYIQAFTVGEAWDEQTITWNNAPLAGDAVAGTWVDPLETSPPWPGLPKHWDVSGAVAEAYAAGTPLRLALYSADWAYHSGRYFYSSDIGGDGSARPTLTVLWGDPVPGLTKRASAAYGVVGDPITYTLGIRGDGQPITLTDTLPAGLVDVNILAPVGTEVEPTYEPGRHEVTWSAGPAAGEPVTLTYRARVMVGTPAALVNTAVLRSAGGIAREATAVVLVNPLRAYLPVVSKSR